MCIYNEEEQPLYYINDHIKHHHKWMSALSHFHCKAMKGSSDSVVQQTVIKTRFSYLKVIVLIFHLV